MQPLGEQVSTPSHGFVLPQVRAEQSVHPAASSCGVQETAQSLYRHCPFSVSQIGTLQAGGLHSLAAKFKHGDATTENVKSEQEHLEPVPTRASAGAVQVCALF
jgi:hypothetical protein